MHPAKQLQFWRINQASRRGAFAYSRRLNYYRGVVMSKMRPSIMMTAQPADFANPILSLFASYPCNG